MASPNLPNLPQFLVFKPSSRQLIDHYLVPKALRGEIIPGYIAEGVDVVSVSPEELRFHRNHRRAHGEVWGYFFGAQPAAEWCLVPGGSWLRYAPEKTYHDGGGVEAFAFRRRFAFYVRLPGGEMYAMTPWLMKEYRLNKDAAAFRHAQADPKANMDCVIHKVFVKPVLPPPPPPPPPPLPPADSSGEESADCSSVDEETDRLVKQQQAPTEGG